MDVYTLTASLLLQLCFAPFASAAPVSTEALDNSWQYGTGGGLLGLVVLILDIIVFSRSPRTAHTTRRSDMHANSVRSKSRC